MKASKKELQVTLETDEVIIQEAEWGNMHVGYETYKAPLDLNPLLKGLPDDRCHSPHWGYVLKGCMLIKYKDHEEVVKAGDAYYTAPGHTISIEAGTELIEFSPTDEYRKTMEVIEHNLDTMG